MLKVEINFAKAFGTFLISNTIFWAILFGLKDLGIQYGWLPVIAGAMSIIVGSTLIGADVQEIDTKKK